MPRGKKTCRAMPTSGINALVQEMLSTCKWDKKKTTLLCVNISAHWEEESILITDVDLNLNPVADTPSSLIGVGNTHVLQRWQEIQYEEGDFLNRGYIRKKMPYSIIIGGCMWICCTVFSPLGVNRTFNDHLIYSLSYPGTP